ncbi:MAG: NADH-quinone oxidoreductase subunit A, partial [Deltaproteobacteria bacterium]|nr:NADH-quinone oxidoreductase subunit A [Deltaproteobacteria bacterium]
LLFDVEVTMLFPWAALFRPFVAAQGGPFILGEGLCFIAVLAVALVYVWRRGALEWET